jgi:hypothetical protein
MSNWDDFVEISQTVFAPLENKFGFQRQTPKQPFVDYDSSNLKVSLFYDVTRGGELDIAIRRMVDVGTQKPSMSISSLMAIYDPASWETYRSPFVNNRPSLERFLSEMKEHLFKYGASLLVGDLRDFDTSDRINKEVSKELGKHRSGDYLSIVKQVVLNFHKKS